MWKRFDLRVLIGGEMRGGRRSVQGRTVLIGFWYCVVFSVVGKRYEDEKIM